jgi:hypothetical protein
MADFNTFVQKELPLRPFVATDGYPGQVLIRSNNAQAVRELVWTNLSGIDGSGKSAYEVALAAGFVGTPQEWLDSLSFEAYLQKSDFNIQLTYITARGL